MGGRGFQQGLLQRNTKGELPTGKKTISITIRILGNLIKFIDVRERKEIFGKKNPPFLKSQELKSMSVTIC